MSIFDQVKRMSDSNSDFYRPKNKVLRLSLPGDSIMVRIMPANLNDEKPVYYKSFRKISVNWQDEKGKIQTRFIQMAPYDDSKDPMTDALAQWRSAGKYPNKYNRGYSNRTLFNVVNVVQANGRANIETDASGAPAVHLLEIPNSVLMTIFDKLKDSSKNPNLRYKNWLLKNKVKLTPDQEADSFISAMLAYPVKISLVKHGQEVPHYDVEIETESVLPPLHKGWESSLEDLNKAAEPTYQSHLSYVNKVLARVGYSNGTTEPPKREPVAQQSVPASSPMVNQYPKPSEPQAPEVDAVPDDVDSEVLDDPFADSSSSFSEESPDDGGLPDTGLDPSNDGFDDLPDISDVIGKAEDK